ncbi:PBP1A family penicillin-binding protein [Roseomonas sp. OT10]|uniref:penicillin-binding protein 1A n=1 Tax=Roseomonas cutis TaxID=2897332 RepID=UPI001E641B1F|nr:PBP1A family penicillin-binding protein [Roseomonas sp. OT10]UFN47830.1 PBP1A family penicillin-binding protein [Roseomonas sp. OT10]
MSDHDRRVRPPLSGEASPADPAPADREATNREAARRPARPARPRRRWLRRLVGAVVTLGLIGVVGGGIAAYGVYRNAAADLPEHQWLADYQPPQMSRIYAADSRLMAELALERRVFIPIHAIPPLLQQAFISAEDQNFRSHGGVDMLAVLRAAVTNVEQMGTGRRAVGASTITQQVAKNMLVGNDRTMMRKVREAILAQRIEAAMPKDRILEIYLNEIFLGSQSYGVGSAAWNYFSKGLDELSVAEMAFLAALPKAPNNYNPVRYPEAAKARRDWVIDRMAEDGAITQAQAEQAKREPIRPQNRARPDVVAVGQYFTEEVRRDLVARFGAEQTTMGGLVVRTSLDVSLQETTEKALREGLTAYDRRRGGWRGPVAQIPAAASEWMPALEAVQRPAGMLPDWRLAVALEVRDREARLAWLERPAGNGAAQPRQGTLGFDAVQGWARPVSREGRLGAAPRRMADVLKPGDVVMVEAPGEAGGPNARPHLALRQIPLVEGAIVALDPSTGRVLAMAGGFSFDKSVFNRATQAMRQPGSSFKPFVYLPALEMGIPPNQQLLDAPIEIMTPQGLWRPGNYSRNTNGWVTMRTALEKSLNLVTVRLAQEVGIDKVADTAARFGVIPNMPRVLAMALGAGETTVLRMAAGYAAFVNGGRFVEPTLIDSVQDRLGHVVWRSQARRCEGCEADLAAGPPQLTDERRQITDPIAAYQMVQLLKGVVDRGTGTAAGKGLNRPIAGKTGTTNDYHDNWFVGFTPDIVIAVWVGFDDPRTLGDGETGGGNAAPIFHDVLEAALKDSPPVPFRAPPGVALVRTTVGGGQTILEAFRPGTENNARPPSSGYGGGGGAPTASAVDSSLGGLY